jgi:hypothetical protein
MTIRKLNHELLVAWKTTKEVNKYKIALLLGQS